MSWALALALLVGLQRLTELALARRNTRRLLAAGGVEHGRRHYPLLIALHAAWLISLPLVVPWDRSPEPFWLALYLALQVIRAWVILTLGQRWTTRIITLPGTAPVRAGPYRFLRHPNYLIVALEVPTLSLTFGAYGHALAFALLNVLILWLIRIPAEEAALARAAPRGEEVACTRS